MSNIFQQGAEWGEKAEARVRKNMMEMNYKQQELLLETKGKMCTALERIAENIDNGDERKYTQSKLLLEKIRKISFFPSKKFFIHDDCDHIYDKILLSSHDDHKG